jgi:hypothetical protein
MQGANHINEVDGVARTGSDVKKTETRVGRKAYRTFAANVFLDADTKPVAHLADCLIIDVCV